MSLIKLAAKIIKSPCKWDNCFHGLIPKKETLLGWNREENFVHYMQKDRKRLRHFTIPGKFDEMAERPKYEHGAKFPGAIMEFTNKNAKRKLKTFDEIYKFKNPESAKRFREQLKEFDK